MFNDTWEKLMCNQGRNGHSNAREQGRIKELSQ